MSPLALSLVDHNAFSEVVHDLLYFTLRVTSQVVDLLFGRNLCVSDHCFEGGLAEMEQRNDPAKYIWLALWKDLFGRVCRSR